MNDPEGGQLFFKLCSDHLSFEAIPRSALKIDLSKLRDHTIRGHKLLMWTPQFVILKNLQGQEITLRRDGRMVIRKVTAESSARKAASAIMNLVTSSLAR